MPICKCSVCITHTIIDEDKRPQRGQYLSLRNIAKHRVADMNRAPPVFEAPQPPPSSSPAPSNSTLESDLSSIIDEPSPVGIYVILFVSWLHLFCNVSRDNCRVALQMICSILHAVRLHPIPLQALQSIPHDPRTLIKKANLDTEFGAAICCRVCFKLYPFDTTTPWNCTYRPFPSSDPCDEDLFIKKKVFRGCEDVGDVEFSMPKNFLPEFHCPPRCVYVTQSVLKWVKWLLLKPDTEQAIDDWVQQTRAWRNQGHYSDIQHGDSFKNTSWSNQGTNSLNIGISLFVDWFNPRGNKLSGKTESMGIVAISCLNLPPSHRNKPSHMCLVGLTPGPYCPDPSTFNHILSPLVDELISLNTGIIIPTHQFPAGRFVQVKLLCVCGDVLAAKKVLGYASHSANKYCSFCHAEKENISELRISRRREKAETIASAYKSKNTTTLAAQAAVLKDSGVRWSELNRLPYWDPSRHLVLGVMHNWLEGVLQGHFRYRWKFWAIPAYEAPKKRKNMTSSSSNKQAKLEGGSRMLTTEDESSDDSDVDILLEGGLEGSFFSQDDIMWFRRGMKAVVLPPGVPHLPPNLGEARHGKLSAAQWHALFIFIIPLVLVPMYVDRVNNLQAGSNRYNFLMNTARLVHCTTVLFARKYNSSDHKRFESNYKKYSDTVESLFPNTKVQPNHHYALHLPEQMLLWGPLSAVAEFSGERLIGFLQKISTNHKIDEMHKTMMIRGCRLQRMLERNEYQQMTADQANDEGDGPKRQTKRPILLVSARYQLLFDLVASRDKTVVHRDIFPIPRGRKSLSGLATPTRIINVNEELRVGTMAPRNCVVVQRGGVRTYGLVKQCYVYNDHLGRRKEFLIMSPITNIYPKRMKVPSERFRFMLFLYGVVVGQIQQDQEVAIEPSQVVYLAAYRLLEPNTFSIAENGIALVPDSHEAHLDIGG